ncbi:RloB-like protein [Burkholderia sp. D7]|nr:RloB-like protein [Burkholderia sp. D7]
MTRRRPAHRPLKQQIYVGCEGASEASYAALLQDFITQAGLPFYLKIDDLGRGAGDPLARVEMAVIRIAQQTKKRTAPDACFLLLDTDQVALDLQRAERARRMAADNNITLVWQDPCFEAVLLRHLPNRAALRPHDSKRAEDALVRDWPDYQKPMPRARLAQRIDMEAVTRAAAAEPDLARLLSALGLIEV